MRCKALLVATLLGFSQWASAQTASVSLSEDSAQAKYSLFVAGQEAGRSEFGMGLLFNKNDNYVAEAGLHVVDSVGSKAPNVVAALGGKLYGAATPDLDVMALGLGGSLRYTLPTLDKRASVGLDFYYAPTIVSFFDAERFMELAFRAQYAVMRQASVFVEMREFRTRAEITKGHSETVKLGEGGRLGLEISF